LAWGYKNADLIKHIIMSDLKILENEGNQQDVRIRCIDYATRVVGKPEYLDINGKWEKHQEDVIDVARQIYEFVTGSN